MTKRKNWLVVIITLLFMCFVLSACDVTGNHESSDMDDDNDAQEVTEETDEEKNIANPLIFLGKFKIEGTRFDQYIFYDPDNLVMYSYFDAWEDQGPQPMVNQDGTYKIYDPETWVKQNGK